jgi:lipopolysaccharide biosynthesis protein
MTKLIAFYLPQFHPIPENDTWWGKGFTEWTNVAKAQPRFKGHHQPQIPADLGFYDLRLADSRIEQAKLAGQYGINGFCYYHYWFNEKMLLEKPFNEVLSSKEPDFPFCLCWANENWTKRWDGLEKHILIEQDYSNYDPYKHIQWLEKAFSDNRYIKINDKPIFLIYRPDEISSIEKILIVWREYIKKVGYPDIYICAVNSTGTRLSKTKMLESGFDAIVDFQPNFKSIGSNPMKQILNTPRSLIPKIIDYLSLRLNIYEVLPNLRTYSLISYKYFVDMAIGRPVDKQRVFPCIFPSWDNSSRRTTGATIIQNDNADLFGEWLQSSIEKIKDYPNEEQILFINAWNEWAEGCHLEPDLKNGKKFIEKIKEITQTT